MEERKHIVILASGEFPTHEAPLRALREADFIVCCDSAYKSLSTLHSPLPTPFIVIGDGDSLSSEDKRQLGDRWIQVDEQDYNDLHKAMAWAIQKFSILNSRFSILAASGKREDHTLGNISYLTTFAEEYPGADIEMLTDHGRLCALRGRRSFESFPHQQVSVFAVEPDKPISADGLRWPLNNFHARRWWQATLNEALGDSFTLQSDGWLILFCTYEPKG